MTKQSIFVEYILLQKKSSSFVLRKEKPPRGCFPSLLRSCYPVHKYPTRRDNIHQYAKHTRLSIGKTPLSPPNPWEESLNLFFKRTCLNSTAKTPNTRNCNGYKDGSCLCQDLFVGSRDRNNEQQQNLTS